MTVRVIDPNAGDPGPLRIGDRLQKCVGNGQRIYKGIRVKPTAELGDVDGREHRRVGNRTAMHMYFDYGTEGERGAMFDDARHAENPFSSNLPNSDRIEYLIRDIIRKSDALMQAFSPASHGGRIGCLVHSGPQPDALGPQNAA